MRPSLIVRLGSLACVVATATAIALAATPPAGGDEAAVLLAAGLMPRDGAYYREGCATAFKPDIERLDVNRDGIAEVALLLGPSRCFTESAGGNVALFMKDADGRWRDVLGFAPGVELVPTGGSSQGFIDLGLVNPGGCMAVFRWDGKAYAHASNRAIEPGGCQFR